MREPRRREDIVEKGSNLKDDGLLIEGRDRQMGAICGQDCTWLKDEHDEGMDMSLRHRERLGDCADFPSATFMRWREDT